MAVGDDPRDDGGLLAAFAATGDAAPFEVLVQRHGRMVFNACRRRLGQDADAEDAAQAVFITLANKAASLRGRRSVAGWLHYVAWNVSRDALKAARARRERERELATMNPPPELNHETWESVRPFIDRALQTMPARYREALLLHYIEGLTQEKAAVRLGCNPSTLSMRLTRGRQILRDRLVRQGAGVSVAALVAALAQYAAAAEMPVGVSAAAGKVAALVASGNATATGLVSAHSSALAKGALHMLHVAKLKTMVASFAALIALPGAGIMGYRMMAADVPSTASAAGFAQLAPALPSAAAAYDTKTAPLMTPWSKQVSPTHALPEHPRPQMVRPQWLNLNGLWEFAAAGKDEPVPAGKTLAEKILVPYPVESALSGVMRHEERMWYRRSFAVPPDWSGRHVLLHFGAVDWQATVYVNGKEAGGHQGGYCGFHFDITDHLKAGANELIVNVFDATNAVDRYQTVGKQTLKPDGYWYTANSGIWQTVWLEAVPASRITRLDMTPDVANGKLRLIVQGAGLDGQTVEAVASAGGTPVGRGTGATGKEIEIAIPNAHLWSPDDPFLYDIAVSLKKGATVVDAVTGYFGMRSVAVGKVAGITRPLLNGRFVFQMGTLDQGWWPDGLYTAPTDEALRFDIEQTKQCGFNTIRKHIKVEPARWYYWTDKLGILVWQDMPAMVNEGVLPDGTVAKRRPEAGAEWKRQFETEFKEMIDQLRSSPSIIGWVAFNEGWGEYRDAKEVMRLGDAIKAHDPSRFLAVETAAGPATNGDVIDWHTYPGPGSPPPLETRFAGEGEFGGIGFVVKDHSWTPVDRDQDTAAKYTAKYLGMVGKLKEFLYSPGLSYAFYTQITDVENERNGFFTYDRAVFKGNKAAIKAAHDDLIAASKEVGRTYTESLGDDFAKTGLWSSRSGAWSAGPGGYTHAAPGLALSTSHFNNCSAEVDITVPATGEAGLLFRCSGEAADGEKISGYCASVSPSTGLTLSYADRGAWTPIHSAPLAVAAGQKCHLKITAFGGTIRIFAEDMAKPVLEVTDYRSLVGAIGVRATGANARFSGLKVANPFVRLRPVHETGFVIHNTKDDKQKDITQLDRNVNRDDDALWHLAPGLADANGTSFESARLPGWYLRDKNGVIRFEKDDGSPEYKREATWNRRPGLGNKEAFSYESPSHPGEWIRQRRPLERMPAPSDADKINSTFVEMK
jgi:RNA polymerase sigma factor (sigma-70 family)